MGIGLVSEIEVRKRGLGGNSIVIRWEEEECAGGNSVVIGLFHARLKMVCGRVSVQIFAD